MVQNLSKHNRTPLYQQISIFESIQTLIWETNLLGPESLTGLESHQLTGKITPI
jgi:hypothetical protein